MHEDLDPADASIRTHQDLARANYQNDAVGPVGWRLRQVEVHLHDESGDQAFRDILVVVAEAEHLRVVDAVQAGVDRIRRQLLGHQIGAGLIGDFEAQAALHRLIDDVLPAFLRVFVRGIL